MPEIVELRVHGVGGTPAEGLLGVGSSADLVQVAGDAAAPFMARKADRAEGYVWGRLTTKGLLQPLWLFLLPFTLVNVAGWMHPPDRDRRDLRGWHPLPWFRALVQLLGLALTVSYVVWLANIVLNKLLAVRTVFAWEPASETKLWMGGRILVALLLLVLIVARKVQAGFEGFPGPGERQLPPAGMATPSVGGILVDLVKAPADAQRLLGATTRKDDLRSHGFWLRDPEAKALVHLHVLAALVVVFWIVLGSLDSPSLQATPPKVRVDRVATLLTGGLLGGLVVLAILQWAAWGRGPSNHRFRWLGPVTTAATGVGLGTGFLYGLTVLFLGEPGKIGALGIAFGMASIGWLIGLVSLLFWMARRKRRERLAAKKPGDPAYVAKNSAARGDEMNGATLAMYDNIAWGRAFSNGGREADRVLWLVQALFVVTASAELLGWLQLENLRYLEGLAEIGNYVALVGVGGVLYFLARRAYRPNQRRIIGILWDVLTFWPRRFHPLGVRPYAERAVPELQHRLVHLAEKNKMIILSAHSQGSVLAYAALKQDTHVKDEVAQRVALVTYGSPLWQLHAMAFPAYFDREFFSELRQRLFGRAMSEQPGWRHFYRRTDYIGKEVFGDSAQEDEVPDPASQPRVDEQRSGVIPSWPDPQRSVWVDLARHSFYNNEEQVKKWLRKLRGWMAQSPVPGETQGGGSLDETAVVTTLESPGVGSQSLDE